MNDAIGDRGLRDDITAAKLKELNEVAEHVPPGVLALRLLAVARAHSGLDAKHTLNIRRQLSLFESDGFAGANILKTCYGCNETKPLAQFRKNPRSTGGRTNQRNECAREVSKEKYRERAEAKGESAKKPGRPKKKTNSSSNGSKPSGTMSRYCENGEDCVAFASLKQPAKLSKSNDGEECYGCQESVTKEVGR